MLVMTTLPTQVLVVVLFPHRGAVVVVRRLAETGEAITAVVFERDGDEMAAETEIREAEEVFERVGGVWRDVRG